MLKAGIPVFHKDNKGKQFNALISKVHGDSDKPSVDLTFYNDESGQIETALAVPHKSNQTAYGFYYRAFTASELKAFKI